MNSDSLVVIAPLLPGVPVRAAVEVSRALSARGGSRSVVLSVVEVPEDRSLSEAALLARRRRELLRRVGGDQAHDGKVQFAVRAARSMSEGIREAVDEYQGNILALGWRGSLRSEDRLSQSPIDDLVLDPPADLVVFKSSTPSARQDSWPPNRVLVPIRGGPHAELALRIGQNIAQSCQAELTVMRIVRPGTGAGQMLEDAERFQELLSRVSYTRLREIEVSNAPVGEAILTEAREQDLLVLGASARGTRTSHMFGALPESVGERASCNVMIVKTREPLSQSMFGVTDAELHSVSVPRASISTVVDQWFAENTFHSHEFSDLTALMRLKERLGSSISVALPALNEQATIGRIIGTIKSRLMDDIPLVDELVVIDSDSTDDTRRIAQDLGVPVFNHADILPKHGSFTGKGEALWKSLYVTNGDIVVWIDSDITDIHPKFVYGLIGPLLTQEQIQFVKGYYRRPLDIGGTMLTTGGGRVTELTARPLINLFYPQLSGLVQPLAGEMAGRRALLERLPFFTGYGVETGLLVDILERFGLDHIAQTDLENRIHRNQDTISLSKMAFGIIQVVVRRLEDRRHIELLDQLNTTMKLIHYAPGELFLEVKEIQENERPPIITIPEYLERRHIEPSRVN